MEDNDYKSMLFPFNLIGDKDPLEAFPRLAKYPEFNAKIDQRDKVLKYIMLAYDPGSPFYRMDSIPQRKANAAVTAGFKMKSEQFDPEVVKMMDCKLPIINLMIIRFCRIFGDRTYTLMVAGSEAFNDAITHLLTPSTGEDAIAETEKKQKIFAQAKANAKHLDEMARGFLSGDDTKLLQKTLYTLVEHDGKIKLTPEDFAI